MFERFTEPALRTLFHARHEAWLQASKAIGTEHLLLGLLREDEGPTLDLLARSGVDVDLLAADLEGRRRREERPYRVDIPFSEETKTSLLYAEEEAGRMACARIGSEHLLLGLVRHETSAAGRTLAAKGMRLDAVRALLDET